jgi:CheY-like chemotaxis protein
MVDASRGYDRESYILVIDDDDTLLKFFKIHLNKFFSKVIVVDSAENALKTLEEKQIDLIISDIRMPKTDGIQLMRKVRRLYPSIPVVLVSGAMLDEKQEKAIEKHADGFLRKPFNIDELHELLQKGMDKRDKLKELADLIADKKNLRDVLNGRARISRFVDGEEKERGSQILGELRKAS